MPIPSALASRLQAEAAKGDMPIDTEVYASAGLDPTHPVVLGSGSLDARIGFFGRDPGRHEVLHQEPFIGAGGRILRDVLHDRQFGGPAPTVEAAKKAGQTVFWGNTVPYKPLGNKAWSMKVKRRFSGMIAELLVDHWQGDQLLLLGNVALDWFRIEAPHEKERLKAFGKRTSRYTESLGITLRGKPITLHPLPHPSPLNARWYRKVPDLLAARLDALGWPQGTVG